MKGIIDTEKSFEVFPVGNLFSFHLFANLTPISREGENGPKTEFECDIFITKPISFESQDQAEDFINSNYQAVLDECKNDEDRQAVKKAATDAQAFLSETDYRILKAVAELPEVRSIIDLKYPGFLGKQVEARALINKVR